MNITGATYNTTSVEYQVANNTNISVGQAVVIDGITPSSYNISSTDNATVLSKRNSGNKAYFTVTKTVSVTYTSGGTAQFFAAANPDLAIVGAYEVGGSHVHGGVFRDVTNNGSWTFFQGYTPEPGVTINTGDSSFALAPVKASTFTGNLIGNVTGNVTGTVSGNAGTVTNGVYTTDTATVTNIMLAGSIANSKLSNSKVTVGTTDINLGSSATTISGLTSVSSTGFTGALTGNADTATKLATPRNINGVAFDGSAAITVKASTTNPLTIGTGLSGSSFDGSGAVTISNTGVLTVNGSSGAITNVALTNANNNFSAQQSANSFVPTSTTVPTAGIFAPATNTLGFSTNSLEQLRIDANGDLWPITNSTLTPTVIRFGDGTTTYAAVTGTYGSSTTGSLTLSTLKSGTLTAALTIATDGTVTLANALPITSGGSGVTARTKGGIVIGTGVNTTSELAVGTNGYLLTADSTATNGVKWAAAPVSLPTQTSNSGKWLTTDGSSASWAYVNAIGAGGTAGTAGTWNTSTTAPTGTTQLNYEGYLYATKVYNAVYNDYAEYFKKDDMSLEAGDIVCINPDGEGFIKSRQAFDQLVVGVYSDDYAHCIGGKGDGNDERDYASVGMAGRVRVKVVGDVKPGDLLVASQIPGVAMAGTQTGSIIAKALEPHYGADISRISALILNA